MSASFPFLTVLVLLPAGGAVVTALVPSGRQAITRIVGGASTLATLGVAAAVTQQFAVGQGKFQMVSVDRWIPSLGISWGLGVDGISLFLVLMTAVLFPVALAGAGERSGDKSFVAWLLVLESGCLGAFLSLDLLLFFLFFELTLVPIYFIIAGWGHEGRSYAATKFFIYTLGASAFLLVGILSVVAIHANQTGVTTFDVRALASTRLSGTESVLLFLAFTAAFAVKAPIFPFHTWSPPAYRESPAAGAIVLAGVMAKLGTYGIVRFDLELFPHAVVVLGPLLLTLGAVGIIYGGIVAAVQHDLKRLIAYSSLAHLGFIVLGAFALTGEALSGAVLQMLNHGVLTAALFLLVAMMYRRTGSFSTRHLSGLQHKAPVMAGLFTLTMLAAIGVPGLNGFVGEFLILSGTFITHRWWAVVATAGVVAAAVYLLWAYQQVFHGSPDSAPAAFAEITLRECAYMAPLVAVIIFLGVYPEPVLSRISPSVNALVAHVDKATRSGPPIIGGPVHARTTSASASGAFGSAPSPSGAASASASGAFGSAPSASASGADAASAQGGGRADGHVSRSEALGCVTHEPLRGAVAASVLRPDIWHGLSVVSCRSGMAAR
ncbi:MAG: complex I subunit 4 family protein [Acidimicrobiales bacterium]